MTLEIIVFILAILFGIVIYWRESKSNKVYRFFNKISHTKELQMKPENKKGFIYERPILMRLVWITLLFVAVSTIITLVTPINIFNVQYFVSAIVGTLLGTYITSAVIFTNSKVKKENLEDAIKKGKDFIDNMREDHDATTTEETDAEKPSEEKEGPEKKSARDRLKDKGMIN